MANLYHSFLFGFEAIVRASEPRLDPPRDPQYVCLSCSGTGLSSPDEDCTDCEGGIVDTPQIVGCACKGDRCIC